MPGEDRRYLLSWLIIEPGAGTKPNHNMKQNKVVADKNLPMRAPLWQSLLIWLMLDRLHAPGVAWGVAYTIMVMIWVVFFISFWTEKPTEIFTDNTGSR